MRKLASLRDLSIRCSSVSRVMTNERKAGPSSTKPKSIIKRPMTASTLVPFCSDEKKYFAFERERTAISITQRIGKGTAANEQFKRSRRQLFLRVVHLLPPYLYLYGWLT
ncbi:hypothetical protein Tsp_10452 [Trichinella spiralis]|uniref:hypothetical protein n=1 Tax=Trichinella spiralis TaxID=6334 RepID=UPI0001EFEE6E|nr:hypothetical protein Tsp_10452 [Trichinella spiralis]